MNVGISDKFYKTSYFPNLPGHKKDQSFSSGSGGSLSEALASLFSGNIKYLYLSYNALVHGRDDDWSVAQQALNDLILTRQIIRLFSSRGGSEDFAQFMFVNGQIVPIWQLIMNSSQNLSLSESLGGNKTQPMTLSIEGRGEIQKAGTSWKDRLAQRIYAVNRAVTKAKIKAHLNLNNLTI